MLPKQQYSDKEKYSIQWFNELSQRRYEEIYEYKYKFAEFPYHGGEKVLDTEYWTRNRCSRICKKWIYCFSN